jgi:hypothetical protein
MRSLHVAFVAILGLSLAGCAGDVSKPTALQDLTPAQKASLHLSDVTADAAAGVEMGDTDFDAVCQKVKAYAQEEAPAVMAAAPAGTSAYKMQIHFTKFDRGSAFARAMLIGLGQIKIEATVNLVDTSGATVASYNVSKDFALGGIAGATTTVADVEDGFAKSVVEIVKAKTV